MIRLLVCDDADAYRRAVSDVLSGDPGLEIVGQAADGATAVAAAAELQPDVVLMDVGMPRLDGLEATRQIREAAPQARVVALTAHGEPEIVMRMLAAGARGVCLKGGDFEELRRAIHAAAAGTYLDERAVGDVVEGAARLYESQREAAAVVARARADLERESDRTRATARALVRSLVAAIETRDGYTGDHTARVSQAAMLLGARICPQLHDDPTVEYGYLLHDVGKLGVPDAILNKPAALDHAERALMERHVSFGVALLAHVPGFARACEIVAGHHERWDGSGYPAGLRGDEIPITARLFAVCDAYDAMTSDRPYRSSLGSARACLELEHGAGSHFDPDIVPEFVHLLEMIDLRATPGTFPRLE